MTSKLCIIIVNSGMKDIKLNLAAYSIGLLIENQQEDPNHPDPHLLAGGAITQHRLSTLHTRDTNRGREIHVCKWGQHTNTIFRHADTNKRTEKWPVTSSDKYTFHSFLQMFTEHLWSMTNIFWFPNTKGISKRHINYIQCIVCTTMCSYYIPIVYIILAYLCSCLFSFSIATSREVFATTPGF